MTVAAARLRWFLLASVILHFSAGALVSPHLSALQRGPGHDPQETLVPSLSLHIEHRTPVTSRRTDSGELQPLSGLSPPQPAPLTLPRRWAKQDFGNFAGDTIYRATYIRPERTGRSKKAASAEYAVLAGA